MGPSLVIVVPTKMHHIFNWEDDVLVEKLEFESKGIMRTVSPPQQNYFKDYDYESPSDLQVMIDFIIEKHPDYDYKTKRHQEILEYYNYLKNGGAK